jgi:hypothetical protein
MVKVGSGKAARRAAGGEGRVAGKDVRGAAAARPSTRAARAAERRAAIVDAALDEFTARGFAATRLDDVAKRAGVAKGTIYLHFADKEALFQELVRSALVPTMLRLTSEPGPESRRGRCWSHSPKRSCAKSHRPGAAIFCAS